jgi:hypothetical protein
MPCSHPPSPRKSRSSQSSRWSRCLRSSATLFIMGLSLQSRDRVASNHPRRLGTGIMAQVGNRSRRSLYPSPFDWPIFSCRSGGRTTTLRPSLPLIFNNRCSNSLPWMCMMMFLICPGRLVRWRLPLTASRNPSKSTCFLQIEEFALSTLTFTLLALSFTNNDSGEVSCSWMSFLVILVSGWNNAMESKYFQLVGAWARDFREHGLECDALEQSRNVDFLVEVDSR